MKKFLVVSFLVLICTGSVFAQKWEFFGELETGLRLDTFGGGKDWYGPDYEWYDTGRKGGWDNNQPIWSWQEVGQKPYAPTISLYNDYYGNYLDLKGLYTNKNYGIYGGVRLHLSEEQPVEITGLLGWVDLFKNAIRVKIGRIQDYDTGLYPLWAAPGAKDCEYTYAEGDGVRFEFRGIRGLNAGVAMYIPQYDQMYIGDQKFMITSEYPNYYKQMATPTGWQDVGKNSLLEDFFSNTAFGMQFENRDIHVAAGLKLDSKADGITDSPMGSVYLGPSLWSLYDGPRGVKTAMLLSAIPAGDNAYYLNKGMKAYAGFDFKFLRPWDLKFGGQAYNLGAFNDYGWMQLNQYLSYSFKWKFSTLGLRMYQVLFFMNENDPNQKLGNYYANEYHNTKPLKSNVIYTFTPFFDFFQSGNILISFEEPFTIWPNIV
ncbi:MAG: hypothetical protein FWF29_12095, partial [Treponema sp.]|nr:hypothetical protein [Treponema sp.]